MRATVKQLFCGGVRSQHGYSSYVTYVSSKVLLQHCWRSSWQKPKERLNAKKNLVTSSDGSQMAKGTNKAACKRGQKDNQSQRDLWPPNCSHRLGHDTHCKGNCITVCVIFHLHGQKCKQIWLFSIRHVLNGMHTCLHAKIITNFMLCFILIYFLAYIAF